MRTDRSASNLEERAKFRNDHDADVIEDRLEHDFNDSFVGGRIAENYDKGRIEVHLHATGFFEGRAPIAGDFCLRFRKRKRLVPLRRVLQSGTKWTAKRGTERRENRNQQASMFVDVIQLVEKPKPVRRRIISEARLQSLDDCLGSSAQKSDSTFPACAETVTMHLDRKCGVSRFRIRQRPFLVGHGQDMDQMIQTRPEILETVSNKLRNNRWRFSNKLTVDDIVSAIRIEFVNKGVRATFNPSTKFRFQFLQMLVRAV
jgi:hypothetical protein